MEPTSISRQDLYEMVWATPMRTLAAKYGLSDVGLAKICDRHEIPRPGLGHWAKVEAGKVPPRPALPAIDDEELQTIRLVPSNPASSAPTFVPHDQDIVTAVETLRGLGQIGVQSDASNLHPIAQRTLRALEKSSKVESRLDRTGLFSPRWDDLPSCVDVNIGPLSFARAALLIDAIFRTCDSMGFKYKPIEEREHRGLAILVLGEQFHFELREKLRQSPHTPKPNDWRSMAPKHDFEPKGILEIRLRALPPSWSKHEWTDRLKLKVEDVLGKAFETMLQSVDEARQSRLVRKRREAEEREASTRAANAEQVRQEDLDRARSLLEQTERWHAAEAVRRYAAAARAMVESRGPIEAGSQADQWLRWAEETANRLDPLTAKTETALRLEALYPPPQQSWSSYSAPEVPRGRPTWLGGWPNWRGRH